MKLLTTRSLASNLHRQKAYYVDEIQIINKKQYLTYKVFDKKIEINKTIRFHKKINLINKSQTLQFKKWKKS